MTETSIAEMSHEDFNANFSDMLAKAQAADAGEPLQEPEQVPAESEDVEAEIDAEADEESGDSEDAIEDSEPEPENPSVAKSVKYFKEQAKQEAVRAAVAEQRYNDLLKAVEAMANKPAAAEPQAEEFEPLDEEAHKRYTQEQQQIANKLEQIEFQSALQQQESAARQAFPDFDGAFTHFQKTEIAKIKAMGVPEEVAKQEVAKALAGIAYTGWKQGRNLGEMFYNMGKAAGYKPTASAKPVNSDALAKNRARTERKPAPVAGAPSGGAKDMLQGMFKDGRVDPKEFQKLLKQHSAS